MEGKSTFSLNNSLIIPLAFLVLFANNVSTEITRSSGFGTNAGPEWTRLGPNAPGVGMEGDRQTQPAANVSLNQLAENINRLEGNLASLIQNFLSLQRSVFNLEQLQEILVLLLEDILKQSGSMDAGGVGVARDPSANPTSSVSHESLDMEDGGNTGQVDSPEIDEDGDEMDDDDKDTADDDKAKDKEEEGGGVGEGEANGKGTGGEKNGGDPSTDPFGALKDMNTMNTPPTTSRFQSTRSETRVPVENNKQPSVGDNDDDDDDDFRESADESEETLERGSYESDEVVERENVVRTKTNSPNTREQNVVQRKPHIQEPLVTFAAQLEARLHDMIQRLSPFHNINSRQMALMRNPDRRAFLINTGESPMAPPPRFEPLEIVAANDAAAPRKRQGELLPMKVKLERQQMSPIISHGGPRVGPEDFSSPFMENLRGGKSMASGESLNERSTGMINNMIQFDQSGEAPPTGVHRPSQHSHRRPETLPSLMTRLRRQTNAMAKLSSTSYNSHSSHSKTSSDKSGIHISFVKLSNNDNNKNTTNTLQSPYTTKFQSNDAQYTTPSTQTRLTTADDFDALIADLLHELSLHLQQQYLLHKHNASMGKNIDRAVLELNTLIWIPSSTTEKSIIGTSNITLTSESNNNNDTLPASTSPTIESSLPSKIKDMKSTVNNPSKTVDSGNSKIKPTSTANTAHHPSPGKIKGSFVVAGAQMDHGSANDGGKILATHSDKQHSDFTMPSQTTTSSIQYNLDKNQTVTNTSNEVLSKQWDWLRELPLTNKANGVDLEWLIDTLATISELSTFSDGLKSISNRGKQLSKKINKVDVLSQNKETTSPNEELDSQEELLSSETEDTSAQISSEENTSEGGEETIDKFLTTTSVNLDQKDSQPKVMEKNKADLQHSNSVFGQSNDKLIGNDVSDDSGNTAISDENNSYEADEDDDDISNETIEQDDEEGELNEDQRVENYNDSIDKDGDDNDDDDDSRVTKSPTNEKANMAIKEDLADVKGNDAMKSNQETEYYKNNDILEESNESISGNNNGNNEDDDTVHASLENIDEESEEMDSSESMLNSYSTKELEDLYGSTLGPNSQHNNVNGIKYSGKHTIRKRHAHHKLRHLPLLSLMRKSNLQNVKSLRRIKRQIPPFWDFLRANNKPQSSNPLTQLFGSQPGHGQSLGNPFSSHFNHPQQQSRLHNPLLGQSVFNPQSAQPALQNHQTGQLSLPGLGQSTKQNSQFEQTAQRNSQFGHPALQNSQLKQTAQRNSQFGQTALQNSQFGNSPLDTHQQLGQPHLHNSQFGHPALQNSQFGQSAQQNSQFGQSEQQNSQFGQFEQQNSQFGNSPLDTHQQLGQPHLHNSQHGQSHSETADKTSFNQQHQQQPNNMFWQQSQQSPNFPFHPPIGGYPQYHGYNGGFHYPQFGYPGYPGSNYEPGESPAAEAAADMEEILTGLFNRYWENVRSIFQNKGQTTPAEMEYEGPITIAPPPKTLKIKPTTKIPPTTAAATTTTNATKPTTPPTTTFNHTTLAHSTMTITTPLTVNHTTNSSTIPIVFNETGGIDSNTTLNTTNQNLNSTVNIVSISISDLTSNSSSSSNSSSVSTNSTSIPPPVNSTSPTPIQPITIPNAPPHRGSTYLFNLIKSLEMMTMTRRPTV